MAQLVGKTASAAQLHSAVGAEVAVASQVSLSPPYLASGTTLDYMYIKQHVVHTYSWEVFKGSSALMASSTDQLQSSSEEMSSASHQTELDDVVNMMRLHGRLPPLQLATAQQRPCSLTPN